jgi:endonuclease/exonuclease/phosphatase family metal-dependent hydrolase
MNKLRFPYIRKALLILGGVVAGWVVVEGGLGSYPLSYGSDSQSPLSAVDVLNLTYETRPYEARHGSAPVDLTGGLRVICWNINGGRDLGKVKKALQGEPADLLILQEVDRGTSRTGHADIPEQLATGLDLNAAFGIEFEELSQEKDADREAGRGAYTGQATLSRFPLRRSRVLRFTHQSSFWQPQPWLPSSVGLFQRRLGGRMALITEHDANGHLLVVYNVHYESRNYGHIQMEQLEETLADMKQYPKNTAFILAGDLNSKYFPHIFRDKLVAQGFQSVTGNEVPRTHLLIGALDWIWLSGPLRTKQGRVRHDINGSDHLPLEAMIEWQ